MQRAFNVEKWFKVEADGIARFDKPEPRRVRIDVLAPEKTPVWYIDGNGELTPLGVVDGRDVLEFRAYGPFEITADKDVWFYTIDGENLAFSIPDAVKLTKIMERRQRNPELERMMFLANQNTERRLRDMRNDMERLFNQRLEAERAATVQSAAESANGGSAGEPEQAGFPLGGGGDGTPDAGSGDASVPGATTK